ncbi:hypothetical protein CRENPOLYSF1_1780002 [Crenothrix polyspora]|uniref:Uncharacterized protein n=1 Tax=Crenothrix polyspora TaxID=360316 RepID=A0A1R4H4E6_9GAMM|nr:hypothetical protein CRENPOLYSF1_1780002 [Crenothrix polyspora]
MKARPHSFDIGDLSDKEITFIASVGDAKRVTNTVIISLI